MMYIKFMKVPFVREWGSWAVFVSSWLAALTAGLPTRPWESGRESALLTALTILGLTFLINSKNPLVSVIRSKGGKAEHIAWLLFFSLTGLALLVPFLSRGLQDFWIFSFLVLSYAVLLYYRKEHHIIAELIGFSMLTLSAPIVYFTITGELSIKLYAAVTLFFAAGVFKVRVRLKKTPFFRWLMVLYCAAAFVIYYLLNISVMILLPFLENIASSLWMREEKLRTTGYTELFKGIVFIVLIGFFW